MGNLITTISFAGWHQHVHEMIFGEAENFIVSVMEHSSAIPLLHFDSWTSSEELARLNFLLYPLTPWMENIHFGTAKPTKLRTQV